MTLKNDRSAKKADSYSMIEGSTNSSSDNNNKAIMIYDGVCYLCNSSVNFIIKRDTRNRFLFTPLQSDYAQALMIKYGLEHLVDDTFILIKDERCFFQSDAALEISKEFSGLWRLLRVFKVVPKPFRDFFYGLIARNRYRLFGKADSCKIPSAEVKAKFKL